ncbi:2OG-Fe(II) oxygenase family protein [Brumicola nitratireducens]|uniref:2-oxoglutarate-dependent ethylene/succinate-forming enzyme n=1 Tax=Glaciecola nitratireducens (strain JCM 12485 / KCTC 12276 / FR1064) TaxID=1085623 RepID=G4QIF9_GLANF|nr:2OG-Fe(II) oxygenase family protein [Glaciecola nitratireducens]AEP30873.1 2OG-Fe(II) oxygenase [Glaciecola nitratireducens FR1064]
MKLEAVDFTAPDAQQKFVESLRQTGFGVLKNHPISQDSVASIYANWQAFFNSEEKQSYLYNKDKQDGFFPQSVSEVAKGFKKKDIKEYFHFYPWGQCPEELRDELSDYYKNTSSLAAQLLNWIEQESPAEVSKHYSMPLSQMIDGSDQTLLRVLHYPPLAGDEEADAIRAAAHEDINLITLLPAANEPGLQVKALDGSWLDVPCDFGNLIVNIGDMLQEASGHYFPSTTHRVINPEGTDVTKSRISLPLFLHPRPDVKLSERHTAGTYLTERLTELGVL